MDNSNPDAGVVQQRTKIVVQDVKDIQINKPSVYVLPGEYYVYPPGTRISSKERSKQMPIRYSYEKVCEVVQNILGNGKGAHDPNAFADVKKNILDATISPFTTLIVVPSHWDCTISRSSYPLICRKLEHGDVKFIEFHFILHVDTFVSNPNIDWHYVIPSVSKIQTAKQANQYRPRTNDIEKFVKIRDIMPELPKSLYNDELLRNTVVVGPEHLGQEEIYELLADITHLKIEPVREVRRSSRVLRSATR